MKNSVTCPHCKKAFELGEAFQNELQLDFQKRIDEEKKKLWEVAQKKAAEQQELQVKNFQNQIDELQKRKNESEKKELDFLKKQRDLEEKARSSELEMLKKVEEEKKRLEETYAQKEGKKLDEALEKIQEDFRKKEQEWIKKEEQMKKSVHDWQRKAEQGSQQIQGDIQENDLKYLLEKNFHSDLIKDVPTGIRGADLVQTVQDVSGAHGMILWESKNTKTWTQWWIQKLKDDALEIKADVCIIVSYTLPEGIKDFWLVDGVWVTSLAHAPALALVLRKNIIEISKTRDRMKGKDEKMEILYSYLSSGNFEAKVGHIVEAFSSLKDELDKEKRAYEKIWARREKQLDRVINSTSSMYGDLEGIMGKQLKKVDYFELPTGEDNED